MERAQSRPLPLAAGSVQSCVTWKWKKTQSHSPLFKWSCQVKHQPLPATPARVDEEALSQLISLGGLIIIAYKFNMCDITYAPTNNLRLFLAHQEKILFF